MTYVTGDVIWTTDEAQTREGLKPSQQWSQIINAFDVKQKSLTDRAGSSLRYRGSLWSNICSLVDLSALLSNLSPQVLDLWKQPIPTTPLIPSQPARKLQQQRRLPDDIVQQLVIRYQNGDTVSELAREFGINRETALEHLKRENISRRPHVRKLTDAQVARAAELYADNLSLVKVAAHFAVNAATIRREFAAASVPVRPRKGFA